MTNEQREYIKEIGYIDFFGNYKFSIAMNEMFFEQWLYEDAENLFNPPENMLTIIGKETLKRMRFVRDEFGLELTEDVIVQIFEKIKLESINNNSDNKILTFRLQRAIETEDFETANKLKEQMSIKKNMS